MARPRVETIGPITMAALQGGHVHVAATVVSVGVAVGSGRGDAEDGAARTVRARAIRAARDELARKPD